MLIVAHRGAPHEHLENTLASFQSCIEMAVDRIELDLQLSKDGKIFIMHDRSLLRSCGIHADIPHLTSAELEHIRLFNGTQIPTLSEVLKLIAPKIELNLELKGSNPALARAAAKLVEKFASQKTIIFSSFSVKLLRVLARDFNHLNRALLWGGDSILQSGVSALNPLYTMHLCQTKTIHPDLCWLNPAFMRLAKWQGWHVLPYVSQSLETFENREQIWQYLTQIGVDGFCTNYPRELLEWQKHKEAFDAAKQYISDGP